MAVGVIDAINATVNDIDVLIDNLESIKRVAESNKEKCNNLKTVLTDITKNRIFVRLDPDVPDPGNRLQTKLNDTMIADINHQLALIANDTEMMTNRILTMKHALTVPMESNKNDWIKVRGFRLGNGKIETVPDEEEFG